MITFVLCFINGEKIISMIITKVKKRVFIFNNYIINPKESNLSLYFYLTVFFKNYF